MTNTPPVRPSPVPLTRTADEALTGVRARRSADFVRVRHGVYAPRPAWRALPPWDRYLTRVHAYALTHPDAVFCLESAAALLGIPVFGEPRDIHVLDLVSGRSHRRGDVSIHSATQPSPLRFGELITTTRAATAVDLFRVLPPAFALAAGDAVLRADPAVTAATLSDIAAAQSERRGRARLPWLFSRVTAESESVGESVSRAVIEWSGFPPPELQVRFHAEGSDDRVDFFWRRVRAIGESDGYGKYSASEADPMTSLRREKDREDRLRRQVDGFCRWDWSDTMRVVPMQRKIALAGVPRPYPAHPALLATLRDNPRSITRSDTPPR